MFIRSLLLGSSLAAVACAATQTKVTFNKDVLPIVQKHCQNCHRPGEVAPMSFLTYNEARPWAKAIRQAALTKKMPPWFADPHYGHFKNDPSLAQSEIDTLVAWADAGAPEGNPKDAPKPIDWVNGWGIGKPDLVLSMPTDYQVPITGTVEYQYIVIPTGFTEDKWIQAAEARPGNRAVTHHIVVFVREPGSAYMRDVTPGTVFSPRSLAQQASAAAASNSADAAAKRRQASSAAGFPTEIVVGYAPGTDPVRLDPGQAKLIKAGSDLVLQLHYTPNGKAATDRSQVGFVFAKQPPKERVYTTSAGNLGFAIPPGDPNYEVKASITLQTDARLVDFNPHMHLRGKDFEFRITYPTGESEVALKVKYDFNWQLYYRPEKPIILPAGTRIDCTAHYDNSANNPANPDPTKTVRWGEQSWEEMMFGWFDVAIAANQDPMDLRRPKKPATGGE
ncbi:MAG TPA: thiol-disulfide isomerase [Bryobacteraceae bacterium]|nr:thiol-disulfide isomerase [Bryobacteraceae bacterium]